MLDFQEECTPFFRYYFLNGTQTFPKYAYMIVFKASSLLKITAFNSYFKTVKNPGMPQLCNCRITALYRISLDWL